MASNRRRCCRRTRARPWSSRRRRSRPPPPKQGNVTFIDEPTDPPVVGPPPAQKHKSLLPCKYEGCDTHGGEQLVDPLAVRGEELQATPPELRIGARLGVASSERIAPSFAIAAHWSLARAALRRQPARTRSRDVYGSWIFRRHLACRVSRRMRRGSRRVSRYAAMPCECAHGDRRASASARTRSSSSRCVACRSRRRALRARLRRRARGDRRARLRLASLQVISASDRSRTSASTTATSRRTRTACGARRR